MSHAYHALAPEEEETELPGDGGGDFIWPGGGDEDGGSWPLPEDDTEPPMPPGWPIDIDDVHDYGTCTITVDAPDFEFDEACSLNCTIGGTNAAELEYHLVRISAEIDGELVQLKRTPGGSFSDFVTRKIRESDGVYGFDVNLYVDLVEADEGAIVTFTCDVITVDVLIGEDDAEVEVSEVKTAVCACPTSVTTSGSLSAAERDGVTLSSGDQILAANNATPKLWEYDSAGAWTDLGQPNAVVIMKGDMHKGKTFVLNAANTYLASIPEAMSVEAAHATAASTSVDGQTISAGERVLVLTGSNRGVWCNSGGTMRLEGVPKSVRVISGSTYGGFAFTTPASGTDYSIVLPDAMSARASDTSTSTTMDGVSISSGHIVLDTSGSAGVYRYNGSTFVLLGTPKTVAVEQGTARGRTTFVYNGTSYVQTYAVLL